MTPADLAEVQRLCAAATPGPWHTLTDGDGNTVIVQTGHMTDRSWQIPRHDEDLEFIAAARTLVPALADEIDALRARVAELERISLANYRDSVREFDAKCVALRRAESAESSKARLAAVAKEAEQSAFRAGAHAMRRAVAAQLRADSDFFTTDVALAVLDSTFAQMQRIDIEALKPGDLPGEEG